MKITLITSKIETKKDKKKKKKQMQIQKLY